MTPDLDRALSFWIHVIMLDGMVTTILASPVFPSNTSWWPPWVFWAIFWILWPFAIATVNLVRYVLWRRRQDDAETGR